MFTDYLSTAELAERWGMHPGSLANARIDPALDHPGYVKINGRVMYPRCVVLEFEDAHYVPPRIVEHDASATNPAALTVPDPRDHTTSILGVAA